MVSFVKWPSTSQLKTAKYHADKRGLRYGHYKAKVKLHGTNASVHRLGDQVIAQSRKRVLEEGQDNAGFWAWCQERKDFWQHLPEGLVVFGEWFGPGVQKGQEATAKVEAKQFAVFALMILPSCSLFEALGGKVEPAAKPDEAADPAVEVDEYAGSVLVADPHQIVGLLSAPVAFGPDGLPQPPSPAPDDIHVLPWQPEAEITIDFENPNIAANKIVDLVESVGKVDPWMQATFGIVGPGEGYVFYPQMPEGQAFTRSQFANYAFKAKCEAHSVQKVAKKAAFEPEQLEGVAEFVASYATEARLAQGVAELEADLGRPLERRDTGAVMRWMNQDIQKESQLDLEANGLEWKQVTKSLSKRISTLWLRRFALI